MNKELVMYYPSNLELIFVHTERKYIMDHLDDVILNKLIKLQREINDMAEGGIYDHL